LAARGLLTFSELIELLFIRRLRQAGVPFPAIRLIAQEAAVELQAPHPFVDRRFYSDWPRRLSLNGSSEQPPSSDARDRGSVSEAVGGAILALVQQLDWADDQVCGYWPLGRNRRVVLDPARAFGQPTDPASGVPTRALHGAFTAGEPVEEVARWYQVDPQAVRDAVEFEEGLISPRLPNAA
jgi:uncharacterized protein (DUF433 family)